MDPVYCAQLADEWTRLRDLLGRIGPDFSFEDSYVPTDFPLLYAQYRWCTTNLFCRRRVHHLQDWSPQRVATNGREIQRVLRSIPGFRMEDDPYYSYYANPDNAPFQVTAAPTPVTHEIQRTPSEYVSEEEEDPEEPPFLEEDQNQENSTEEDEVDEVMEEEEDNEGWLSPNEEDDDGWLAPIDAPVNWENELQWRLMHLEPIVPIPPPPPPALEEEDLEREVDDLKPPVFAPNTYVFVKLAPLYPCPWKRKAQPFYLGPVRVLSPRQQDYYQVAVPSGFAEHYSEYFLHTLVTNRRPKDVSRIIPVGVDYNDHREYVKTPIHMQNIVGPNEHQHDPQWTVTWECYGVTEQTMEPERVMRRHYSNFFDD
ncbi:hypothetical protein RHGRI_029206 [Rhododendron griersonianum]|uniref:Uncharacterized protein n=1 Tax=Rhododendron griersonianum TaxID=479676 RepID=A0AAV6IM64_9ERIC|nr:hypothetical protein RHGRI_029206 [Rhododendron griersonianum]